MKTTEIINIVCDKTGITKADLAREMGIFPSSFYRKLSRESMTFEELQKCLDVLGVTVEYDIKFPDGSSQNSQNNYEILLERSRMLEAELEASKKTGDFHKKTLKELRTELSNVVGYTELSEREGADPVYYLEKIRTVLEKMEKTVSYALGDVPTEDIDEEAALDAEFLAGQRVLLVDDNEMNRDIMRELLVRCGLEVTEAGNGLEAVNSLKAENPGYFNYILMDIEMPVMNGYEATVAIRRLPNRIRANVPIIAITANAFHEDRELAAASGMDDFISKPMSTNRLLRCLMKYR